MEYRFSTTMGSLTVNTFIEKIKSGEIKRPEFQRNYQWYKAGAEKFIRNIKNNYFIPQIILFVYEGQTYILDGQQRLTSLYLYNIGKFKRETNWDEIMKEDDKEKSSLEDWKFAENDNDKDWLKGRELSYVLLQQVVPDKQEAKKFYAKLFRDINAQGVIVTPRELRESVFWIVDNNNAKNIFNFGDFHGVDWLRYIVFSSIQISHNNVKSTLYQKYMSQFTDRKLSNKDKNKSAQEYELLYEYFLYEYFEIGNDTEAAIPQEKLSLLQDSFTQIKGKIQLDKAKAVVKSEIDNISRHKPAFSNITELDIYLFGLVVFALKGCKLKENSSTVYAKLNREIQSYLRGTDKPDNTPKHIYARLKISIECWKNAFECEAQQ